LKIGPAETCYSLKRTADDLRETELQETTHTAGAEPARRGEHLPKEVLSIEFNPKKRLAHFMLELKNIPGALEKSSAIPTRHRVNILSGFHHAPSASRSAFWSFFADFTEADTDAPALAREFETLTSTISVRFQVPPNGLLVDSFHFPLSWGGHRAIMMRTESMTSIFARINGIFGDGPAAKVVMFEMGEAAGQAIYKDLAENIGDDTIRRELSNIIGLYSSCGWGIFELLHADLETKTVLLRVKHNFECDDYRGKSTIPRGNFVRGHLAGWFSQLFGARTEVSETKCVAKGDLFCEFEIHPAILDASGT